MTPSLPLSFFFFFLLLFHQNLSHIDASVEEVCMSVYKDSPNINYDWCLASLESDPKSRTADHKGLALIAISLSTANARSTKSKIKQLLENSSDPNEKQCLNTCLSLYSALTHTLTSTIDMIKSGRYYDAEMYLAKAIEQPGRCEDAFKEKGIGSTLAKEDGDCKGLSTIAFNALAMGG